MNASRSWNTQFLNQIVAKYWPLALFLLIAGSILWRIGYQNYGFLNAEQRSNQSRQESDLQYALAALPALEIQDPDSAILLARSAIALGDSLQNNLGQAQGYYWLSKILLVERTSSEGLALAKSYCEISQQLFEKEQHPFWEAKALAQLASIHSYVGEQKGQEEDSSFLFWEKASLEVAQIKGNREDSLALRAELEMIKSSLLNHLDSQNGSYSTDTLEMVVALVKKSLELYRKLSDPNLEGEGICLRILGNYYGQMDSFPQSIAYFDSALLINQQIGSELAQHKTLRKKANAYIRQYANSQASEWLEAGIESYRAASQLQANQTETLMRWGGAYQYAASNASGSMQKAYVDSAAQLYQQAIKAAIGEDDLTNLRYVIHNYQSICADLREQIDCQAALDLANQAYYLIARRSQRAQAQAERDKHEFEMGNQQKQAAQSRTNLMVGAGVLLLLFLGVFFLFYQRQRAAHERQELEFQRKELEAQLKALQAQMNPHFISNSLSAIEALINKNQNRDAANYLVNFSHLARMILSQCQESVISLRGEIHMLELYLSLEKLRMGEKLNYSIEREGELDSDKIKLPPMMLQPFVENAIWHGLKSKEGEGHLAISFRMKAPNTLICVVEDDGIGRQKAKELSEQSAFRRISYSTQIIEERIAIIKRQIGANLKIIDLADADGNAAGTRVEIYFSLDQNDSNR